MKRIDEIDRNMAVAGRVDDEDVMWLPVRQAPFRIEGLYDPCAPGPFRRLPKDVADATNEGVAQLALNTAGGRVRFMTDSPYVAIHADMSNIGMMDHMPATGIFGFDMYVRREGRFVFCDTLRPPLSVNTSNADKCGLPVGGYESKRALPEGMCEVMINFPLYNGVDELLIGVREGSAIEAAPDYAYPVPVVYYGSSITQGGCASRPGNSYQAIISRMLDCDHVNLGFSGSARGEDVIVQYMAGLDMSVFVCDYDHNAPTAEHLEATHRPLYESIRARNPELPIIFVTRPDVNRLDYDPVNVADYARRRDIVRATYDYARSKGDERVSFIDGETLFDGPMRDSCTVDGCHPNDLGFMRMAQVIGAEVERQLRG